MKKIFKCTITLFVTLVMFISFSVPLLAIENKEPISVQINENEIWVFPTEDDYNAYLKHQEQLSNSTLRRGEYTTTTEVSRKTLKHKFVGYHKLTPVWQKTSYYKIKSGETSEASTSTSFDGISFTLKIKHSMGITTQLNADASRYSRLGLSGDFLVKHMRTNYFDASGLYDTYDYISTKTLEKYLDVKYKS